MPLQERGSGIVCICFFFVLFMALVKTIAHEGILMKLLERQGTGYVSAEIDISRVLLVFFSVSVLRLIMCLCDSELKIDIVLV